MPMTMSNAKEQERTRRAAAEFLRVRFPTPLEVRKRRLVYAVLSRYNPSCQTLLDVGTGQGELLRYLKGCSDEVPLINVVGIDPQLTMLQRAAEITRPSEADTAQDRWRPFNVSLYHGGVADLSKSFGTFECITAIEVLQHLSPSDFTAFGENCLGHLRPRLMFVTTPNRDFNEVFDRLDATAQYNMFHRDELSYSTRHEDHRFEMTRSQFQSWAERLGSKFGYRANLSGVGTVEDAFDGQPAWQTLFPEEDLLAKFGYHTQIAAFLRLPEPVNVPRALSVAAGPRHVETHMYPFETEKEFPPSVPKVIEVIYAADIYFRPIYNDGTDYAGLKVESPPIEIPKFFETCYAVQRLVHFRLETFEAIIHKMSPGAETYVLPRPSTSLQAHSMDEEDPVAELERIELLQINEAYFLQYVFDTTAFTAYQNDRREAQSSLVSGADTDGQHLEQEAWDDTPSLNPSDDQTWS